MSAESFDSNILIYLFDETDDRKRAVAEALVSAALETGNGVVSYQAVQETVSFLTRRAATGATDAHTRQFLDGGLSPLWRVTPSRALFHRALDIRGRYGYTFYDALVVAGAVEAGSTRLYSQDLEDGQIVHGVTIVNSFRTSPGG